MQYLGEHRGPTGPVQTAVAVREQGGVGVRLASSVRGDVRLASGLAVRVRRNSFGDETCCDSGESAPVGEAVDQCNSTGDLPHEREGIDITVSQVDTRHRRGRVHKIVLGVPSNDSVAKGDSPSVTPPLSMRRIGSGSTV
jgi:hypothetical protein